MRAADSGLQYVIAAVRALQFSEKEVNWAQAVQVLLLPELGHVHDELLFYSAHTCIRSENIIAIVSTFRDKK